MADTVLRFAKVRREYAEVVALAGLDLSLAAGRTLIVVGHNGSGKTTAMQLAAGRLEPSSGRVEILGLDTTSPEGRLRIRQSVGFVLDLPVFYPDLTVEEHLTLVATAHGVDDADERIEELLELFDLEERQGFLPDQLSSGMRQKLQIACVLVRPADVLLLDEPSRALDPRTREVLWSILAGRREHGTAIVMTTHQLDFPSGLADDALVLGGGEVIASGDYDEVVAGPAVRDLGLS